MKLFKFIKQVFQEFGRDKAGQLSAAFAYVTIFALGPLLLVLISVVGFVLGEKAAQGELYGRLADAVGPETAKTIQDVVVHTHQSANNQLALVVGIVGMLLAAAALTTQLQNSFNTIFQVVPDPKGGLKRTIYVKIKNILVVGLAGLVAIASLTASTLITGLGNKVREHIDVPPFTLEVLNSLVSLAVFVLILYLLYRILPDVRIPRKVSLAAAGVVALLFVVGKLVLAVIIGNNGTASAYGAAASLVTLLLWVFYSGQILFIGAEGIKVYGQTRVLAYEPKKYNLKRHTFNLDSDKFSGKLIESWLRGFRNKSTKK